MWAAASASLLCPVGALYERDDVAEVEAAIADPDKFVVIQAAPSVRVGLGEAFKYPVGSATKGKLAAALRALGFDRVFDTVFSADLTIMEEATELVERIKNGGTMADVYLLLPGLDQFCGRILRRSVGSYLYLQIAAADVRCHGKELIFLKKKAFRRIVSL